MKPKQEGPFVITEVLGPVTYRLKLLTSWQIHNVFHATLLKPYRENEIYRENFTEPPPELVEGEEVLLRYDMSELQETGGGAETQAAEAAERNQSVSLCRVKTWPQLMCCALV